MSVWLAVLGVVVLGTIGVWTITHPDGGYRAVGGVGSGLSPSTRRASGVLLVAVALIVLVMVLVLADAS